MKPSRVVESVRSTLTNHRMIQAVKVAVAATLAWVVVLPWGGIADDYPYYAPLGAVSAVAGTVASTWRATLSSIAAIAAGAVPALVALAVPVPEVLGIAAVVLVGSWLAGSPRLGPMASWVPISGLFILIIGRDDPWYYAGAYLGLVALGALIGLVVDAAWPALPLNAAQSTVDTLRDSLADQLRDIAEGLSADPLPTGQEWRERRRSVGTRADEMHRMVGEVRDAQRINWRAGSWRETAARQHRQATALAQLAFFVEEAFDLVARTEQAEREEVAFGPMLRPAAARALSATADALADVGDATSRPATWATAWTETDALAREIRQRQFHTTEELFVAGSVVTTLRRALRAVEPPDEAP